MLDWLPSKVTVTLVALSLLGLFAAFFQAHQANLDRDHLEGVASTIASKIQYIDSMQGNTSLRITFKEGYSANETYIPATIGGDKYHIYLFSKNFTTNTGSMKVQLETNRLLANRPISHQVHLWNPGNMMAASPTDLKMIDTYVTMDWHGDNLPGLDFISGDDFNISRRYISGAGFQTFIYLDREVPLQNVCDNLAASMNEFPGGLNGLIGMPGGFEKITPKIEQTINGKSYSIEIWQNMIILKQDNLIAPQLLNMVHLWDPSSKALGSPTSPEVINAIDEASPDVLKFSSSQTFTIEWKIVNYSFDIYVLNPETGKYEHQTKLVKDILVFIF